MPLSESFSDESGLDVGNSFYSNPRNWLAARSQDGRKHAIIDVLHHLVFGRKDFEQAQQACGLTMGIEDLVDTVASLQLVWKRW